MLMNKIAFALLVGISLVHPVKAAVFYPIVGGGGIIQPINLNDGSSASAPLLPEIINDAGFQFNFGVEIGRQVFIDPEVAIGYEYRVNNGPNILRALFSTVDGDADGYEIFSHDKVRLGAVNPGEWFSFGPAGVTGFTLRGIDVSAGLDPTNVEAFVTGLEFVESGQVSMVQQPIVFNTDGTVPEPASLMLLAVGALASLASRRQRSIRA